jgi:polar amino acid transport system substrate-binding protein
MKKTVLLVCVFVSLVSVPVCLADCTLITVHYHERVPYVKTTENGLKGLTASPATTAFKKSGIPFKWENTPSKRQMMVIEENMGCDCAVGWFKNPDREKFAKFTHHLYQDKAQVALARADNEKLQNGISVDSVLSNPKLTLGVKDGYSYGSFLNAKIAQHKPVIDSTTYGNINILKKIHAGRGDYFFIAPEEADALIESSGLPKKDFKFIKFSDMPEGEKRYILCSKKVGDKVIEKLNTAIIEYVFGNK